MENRMFLRTRVWVGIGFVLWGAMALADDWPQWRGPQRDGVWREDGIVERFSGPRLEPLWRAEVGPGYCGPTVADGRVYVADRVETPTERERVHCFDAATGARVWSYDYECRYGSIGYTAGPRASITIHDGRAYFLGTAGHLHCFDAATGEVLWRKDARAEYKIAMPIWGIAAAPLVEGELLIVQIGGADDACIVAFDRISGRERWRALGDRASYSAPIVIEQAGRRVLVCWTGDRVAGLDPLTGKLHWQEPFVPTRMVINIATPVLSDNHLFVSSFYDGSMVLKIDPNTLAVEKLWHRRGSSEQSTESLHCCISTPVILGDYVYGIDSFGELRCLDLKTGDRIWGSIEPVPRNRWANVHIVRRNDDIWMFNEKGELIICRLSTEGYREISRTRIIEPTTQQLNQRGGVCWSHPAFANRRIYVRNDNELLAVSLASDR